MKLLFLVSEASKPDWRAKTLYFMEQPQDPREYRRPEDVAKYEFMSVWRTDAWKRFQERHGMLLTSLEQGAFGHAKPKPTTVGHNIDGIEQLHGAKTQRDPLQGDGWVHKSLSERMAESSTWSEWAPGVKAALMEGGDPLCGRGKKPVPDDAPLPGLDDMVGEDGVCGDMEDYELPRFESDEVVLDDEGDPAAVAAAQASYASWMKLVEECKDVKVRTLTFVETLASRATADVMNAVAQFSLLMLR
eukprot:s1047_g5.t1